MTLRTQAEAERQAKNAAVPGERMAIVLTTDDHGTPTHDWCRADMADTLYGPLLKAEAARIVSYVPGKRS